MKKTRRKKARSAKKLTRAHRARKNYHRGGGRGEDFYLAVALEKLCFSTLGDGAADGAADKDDAVEEEISPPTDAAFTADEEEREWLGIELDRDVLEDHLSPRKAAAAEMEGGDTNPWDTNPWATDGKYRGVNPYARGGKCWPPPGGGDTNEAAVATTARHTTARRTSAASPGAATSTRRSSWTRPPTLKRAGRRRCPPHPRQGNDLRTPPLTPREWRPLPRDAGRAARWTIITARSAARAREAHEEQKRQYEGLSRRKKSKSRGSSKKSKSRGSSKKPKSRRRRNKSKKKKQFNGEAPHQKTKRS